MVMEIPRQLVTIVTGVGVREVGQGKNESGNRENFAEGFHGRMND